jgi:predicted methyltransferase
MNVARRLLIAVFFLSSACGGSPPPASSPAAAPLAPPAPPMPQGAPASTPSPAVQAVVDASDRSPQDRELDAGRHPGELLAFAGITPGMRVADLAAGLGYTTEILARAVGPMGVVYSQNNKLVVTRFADKPWSERLAKPVLKNVVRVEREFDAPLPPEANNLDAVFVVLFYHDAVWMGADRDKMNRAVFDALKPGGEYIVVDHSAKSGSGLGDVKTLHRIDEQAVLSEVSRAGFRLAGSADFLRNPSDARDWNDSPMVAADRRGKSDRFVLKFVKP